MHPGGKVPECLNNVIVVIELLNDEIYGWMLKTTDNLEIDLSTRIVIFQSITFLLLQNF